MIRVEQEIPHGSEVRQLLRLDETGIGLPVETLLASQVRFFVARSDGLAVGCGGYVPTEPGTAELQRLFVHPEHRRNGIGHGLLAAIEALARLERFTMLRLEADQQAAAAIRLFHAASYRDTAPFGLQAANSSSRFMEKSLGPALALG